MLLGYEDYQRLVDLKDRYESALLTRSLKDNRFLTVDEAKDWMTAYALKR